MNDAYCIECRNKITYVSFGKTPQYCFSCVLEHKKQGRRKWAQEHPELRGLTRWRGILKERGLTQEVFDEITKKQNGCCKVCKRPVKKLKIDHDHLANLANKFRGLICSNCNVSAGHMQDNPHIVRRLALYLEGKL